VGKADPANRAAGTAMSQGHWLARRPFERRRNIAKAVATLRLEDFDYRSLEVKSG
jgi:hypothetical protein